MKFIRIIGILAALAAAGCATAAQGGGRYHSGDVPRAEPWSKSELAPVISTSGNERDRATEDQSGGLGDLAFSLYAGYLTKVDGPRCEHRPTCSYYTVLAIRRHGYVVGSMLTIDRLLRGSRSSTLRRLPIYKVEKGRTYFYDPVEHNDFFL